MNYPTPLQATPKDRDDIPRKGRRVKQASISSPLIAPRQLTIPFPGSTQLFIPRTVTPLVPKAHRDKTISTCIRTHHTFLLSINFTRALDLLPRPLNSVWRAPLWTSVSSEASPVTTSKTTALAHTLTTIWMTWAATSNSSNECTMAIQATWAPLVCHPWSEEATCSESMGNKEGGSELNQLLRIKGKCEIKCASSKHKSYMKGRKVVLIMSHRLDYISFVSPQLIWMKRESFLILIYLIKWTNYEYKPAAPWINTLLISK